MEGDGAESTSDSDIEAPRPDEDDSVVTLPWQESGEREFKDIFATITLLVLVALAVVGFYNAARGEPGSHLASAIVALAMAVAGFMSWYGPFGSVGTRLSVDERGLWLRHQGWRLRPGTGRVELLVPRHLPAAEIGDVLPVSQDARGRMRRESMSLTYEGRALGWTRTKVDKGTTEAVLIEQRRPGLRRPWWLLRCSQREQLIRALELARAASG